MQGIADAFSKGWSDANTPFRLDAPRCAIAIVPASSRNRPREFAVAFANLANPPMFEACRSWSVVRGSQGTLAITQGTSVRSSRRLLDALHQPIRPLKHHVDYDRS
eukprot:321998-Prorocentrum_minimum.AAC.1